MLPAAITGALLTRVPALPWRINDVLLTGLVVAIATGADGAVGSESAVLLDLEGHGREEVSRIWTSRARGLVYQLFPVRLEPGALDVEEAMAAAARSGGAQAHQGQPRALPDNGLGYGLLLSGPETAARLAGFAAPQIGFDYLGGFAARRRRTGRCRRGGRARPATGDAASPRPRGHALTLDDPEGQVTANWSWAPALVSEAKIRDGERWFAALEALVRHVAARRRGRTPSDLPLVALTQAEIEGRKSRYGRIEESRHVAAAGRAAVPCAL